MRNPQNTPEIKLCYRDFRHWPSPNRLTITYELVDGGVTIIPGTHCNCPSDPAYEDSAELAE